MGTWEMQLCCGNDEPLRKKTFTSWEDAEDWVRRNHPGLVSSTAWSATRGNNYRQFGTGYYWATFSRIPSREGR